MSTTPINCGVPQGSPCSPALFILTLAETLHETRPGVSYVDDCSWVNFQAQFQAKATQLLNEVNEALTSHGFQVDEAKTKVTWIFASERPRAKIKEQALTWRLR